MEWLKYDVNFAATFSYRVPDTNPWFTLASPVPSPSAIKMSVISSAILTHRDLNVAADIFKCLKGSELRIIPPENIAIFRSFVKRLKSGTPVVSGEISLFGPSTGSREYAHLSGPITVFIGFPILPNNDHKVLIESSIRNARRLGTTDSIVTVSGLTWGANPDKYEGYSIRPLGMVKTAISDLSRCICYNLSDIADWVDDFKYLNHYNPEVRKEGGNDISPIKKEPYLIPITLEQSGENWALYKRVQLVV